MYMKLKKVWMAPDTAKKSHYAWRTLGGNLGIAALMLVLIMGGTVLSFAFHWPRELFSLLLCVCVTVLGVWLSLRLGQRSVQDDTVFLLTESDQLFVMQARRLSDHSRGIWGYAAGTWETQTFLRQLAKQPFVPAGADEILKVTHIKETSTDYVIRCQVRHPNRHVVERTYFLVKGCEDEDLLLHQLERRERWENTLEPPQNRTPFAILLSALVFVCFTALCVLSHPAIAKLPQSIYFPCLGADFVAVCVLVCFIVRQRRGE